MLEKYVLKNGKRLKYGYTTGSCAAAASKASAIMALTGNSISSVTIDTPKGWNLKLAVLECKWCIGTASCSIKKDAGDDPDKTHGLLITSTVQLTEGSEVIIKGGKGVGVITKHGLPVAPGNPAINPVPQMMIRKEVIEVLPAGTGAIVTISVDEGERIAKKTFNPKLGIVGGISILGTTGIVEPMSEEAFKDSLAIEVNMAASEGLRKLVLVPGNHGRDMALEYYGLHNNTIIKTSNFIGFMLEKCVDAGFKKILFIGHMGKLVKLSGGIFHTHSRVADGRMEILAANLSLMGARRELIEKLFDCPTTDAAYTLIHQNGFEKLFDNLSIKAENKCEEHVYNQLEVGVIMFSTDKRIVGMGTKAKALLEEFQNE